MPAESLNYTNCPPCPLSPYQKTSCQDKKTTTPLVKSMFLQPSKSPQAAISITREIQRQEKEKRSLGESPANRPAPGSQVGLSSCHLGTVKACLQSQPISEICMFWFLFFRPTVKQKWFLCLSHHSPPSGIHTPTKQSQKSHNREPGFDWLLPTVRKTENWEKAHIGSFFRK